MEVGTCGPQSVVTAIRYTAGCRGPPSPRAAPARFPRLGETELMVFDLGNQSAQHKMAHESRLVRLRVAGIMPTTA